MRDILKSLQQKSDAQKAFYAVAISVVTITTLFGMWGYNFANGDSVNNIAGGAVSIARGVEGASKLSSNFSNTLEQLQQINDAANKKGLEESNNAAGAKVRYQNVFDYKQQDTLQDASYGENPADVLY